MKERLTKLKKKIKIIDEKLLSLVEERIRVGVEHEAIQNSVSSADIRSLEEQEYFDRVCSIGKVQGFNPHFITLIFYSIVQYCRRQSMLYDIEQD